MCVVDVVCSGCACLHGHACASVSVCAVYVLVSACKCTRASQYERVHWHLGMSVPTN